MPCHTCSFRRVAVRGTAASLPADTVTPGPVDKQPGISLASFLDAALHVKHLSPLIAAEGLWGTCLYSKSLVTTLVFNMASGKAFQLLFASLSNSFQFEYHKLVSPHLQPSFIIVQ